MEELFDPIRQCWVEAKPEEKVRQKLLSQMIEQLGYPRGLLCVEKDIGLLPHLSHKSLSLPKRRLDILCFGQEIHSSFSLYPLLMIECKAHPLSKEVIEQVVGYNYHVGAYFVAIANEKEVLTLWWDEKEKDYLSVSFLPSFEQLIKAAQKHDYFK